ncbi:pirin family protein [Corticibacter populi]|uniref:Pirin family protein n=1 Tax=Corticibacter populi TaxID=1550736 RepID=A0A3M6QZR9_9BURK|nr:pirin family protein [Corticibacter populi]RMX08109.1 pirin family protein [Corticibacter populi]RZS35359.1 hypothetical protein EV687_0423 [Corticibacter populi]
MLSEDKADKISTTSPAAPQRIPARMAEIGGGVPVRRVLPSRGLRTIGAWCFLDHAGPAPRNLLSVGQHPHIGLQTFTWMIEGEIMHRDSLGSEQVVRPGEINLMTAGRGISHVEEAHGDGPVHTVQLWIALPESQRQAAPRFEHYAGLPRWEQGGWQHVLLAGELAGRHSPVEVHSPLLGLDLRAEGPAKVDLALDPAHEYGVLVLTGSAEIQGEALAPGELLYLGSGHRNLVVQNAQAAGVHLLVIGGEPLAEAPLIWWNFVGCSTAEILQAAEDWSQHDERFGTVPGTVLGRLQAPDASGLRLRR